MAGKQDPNVGRKKSNPRKRLKGPMPSTEIVVNCHDVFGLTTSKQPHLSEQRQDMLNFYFPSSISNANNQTPADSPNVVLWGGPPLESKASVHLTHSVYDASGHLQPGSGRFDTSFSFLADLFNDDPVPVSLAGPANPVQANRGWLDHSLPSHVSASSPLVMLVTATSWGIETATPTHNVHMAASWRSKSVTPSPNVPIRVSWGSKPATPLPNLPIRASRGPKPAMPPVHEPYQVGTIWGNVTKCCSCKRDFPVAVTPDDQFVLVRAEFDSGP